MTVTGSCDQTTALPAAVLEVTDLSVAYGSADAPVRVVNNVSFAVAPGEALGIVGESGSGKSQTMLAALRLLPQGGRIDGGRVLFEGRDLSSLSPWDLRAVRGSGLAYISQDALSALNPIMTVGDQMAEPLIRAGADARTARARCVELLDHVGIPGAAARLASYPHQLSGGMRQRVLIAMAISAHPQVLIADEPTTALDVTLQAQILNLIDRLRRELGMALVLVSHDLGVVSGITDRVAIMYAGRIVETATTTGIFDDPRHPYTRALLDAIPRLDAPVADKLRPIPGRPPEPARPVAGCAFHPRCALAEPRCRADRPELAAWSPRGSHLISCWVTTSAATAAPIAAAAPEPAAATSAGAIAVDDLRVHFPVRVGVLRRTTGLVRAVDGVSFAVPRGRTVGLVGESGSGKSTIGRALLDLVPASSGHISYFGRDLPSLRAQRGALPRLGQMIFQDPYASLNPRMTIEATLSEVFAVHRHAEGMATGARIRHLLDSVGLHARTARLYPHELSGGQRQRIAIARALAMAPEFIVCDEVVSALDVSIQGQIVNLLQNLQRERGLTYLFISHDLSVVRHISHVVAVMYSGKLMEVAPRDRLFAAPCHPYTHVLLSAVSLPNPRRERGRRRVDFRTEPPDPAHPPPGCRFQRSCRFASDLCRGTEPPLRPIAADHRIACHHWDRNDVRAALTAINPQGAAA